MEGEGPHVNKFEQVSSDGHQMSLVVARAGGVPCLMSGAEQRVGAVGSELQCIMVNSHMGTPSP